MSEVQVGDWVTWNYPSGPKGLYGYKYRLVRNKHGVWVPVGWEPKRGWGNGPFRVTQVIEVAKVAREHPTVDGHHRRSRTRVEYGGVGHTQWIRIERDGKPPREGTFSGKLFRKVNHRQMNESCQ